VRKIWKVGDVLNMGSGDRNRRKEERGKSKDKRKEERVKSKK